MPKNKTITDYNHVLANLAPGETLQDKIDNAVAAAMAKFPGATITGDYDTGHCAMCAGGRIKVTIEQEVAE